MRYVSTRDNSKEYSFEDVFIKGLADDGGLYVPTSLKKFSPDELSELKNLNYNDLSTEIINQFSSDFIPKDDLSSLINKSYSTFREKDVVKISNVGDLKLLELFHGPTLAFKDIAMQFIGNLYEYYLSKNHKKINIVVATSGDTGAAAIDAIKGKSNLNIFVLHPNNRISPVQRKLMTTVEDENVFNIAIDGNFDDCQNIVKQMFSDLNFSKSINMSGVNSINWARIIAQAVYYFYTYFKLNVDIKRDAISGLYSIFSFAVELNVAVKDILAWPAPLLVAIGFNHRSHTSGAKPIANARQMALAANASAAPPLLSLSPRNTTPFTTIVGNVIIP